MLTLRALSNARQAAIYFETDDYYVEGEQLSPSSWWGSGAERLGLSGEVDRNTFAELLSGRLGNGQVIAKGDGSHRPGVDLAFSAPKSVSLAALVGGDHRILEAHGRAVTAALGYLEATAPRVRTKSGGVLQLEETHNLLVARFNHDSSRALDPQLHTHAVVLNATERKDGVWKALSNEELFRSAKAAGAVYRAELARDLLRLGYRIERTHADGRFEIAGISKTVLGEFSQRRAQILAHLDRMGFEGPKAGDVAARATRDPKRDVRRSLILADWQNRARTLGLDFNRIRSKALRWSRIHAREEAEQALDHAIQHLTERKVVTSERQIIQSALGVGVGRTRLSDLQKALARRLERGELVPGVSSRRKDPFARHYTTDRAVAVEQDLIHLMKQSRETVAPILGEAGLDGAIGQVTKESPFPLTAGQESAIRLALSTPDRLVGIQGFAGTGKTTGALLHIRQIAEAAGFEVRGYAPSAVAAELLEREAGIKGATLARLLNSGPNRTSSKPQLWIVDEVSMMGNEAAHALLLRAKEAGARLIWVGDRDQLPSIAAGRAFGLLMDHGLNVVEIDTIVRQRDPVLREAVEKTIRREHEEAVRVLRPRVHEIQDRTVRLRNLAATFLELPEAERRNTLVVTPSNGDRRKLNDLLRNGLRKRNVLTGPQVESEILVGRVLTRAEARDTANYRVGDVVRFNAQARRLGIARDEYLRVVAASPSSETITLQTHDGRDVPWKPKRSSNVEVYEVEKRQLAKGEVIRWTRNDNSRGRHNAELAEVLSVDVEMNQARVQVQGRVQSMDLRRDRHWEHAYVSTVHAAQGRTADRLLLHLDTGQGHLIGHESWYVGISRARKDIQIFTDDVERLPVGIAVSLEQESALEVVRRTQVPLVKGKGLPRDTFELSR